MKKIYFTPGPAELYPTTIKHFQKALQTGVASMSHRSREFREMFEEVTSDLKKLLNVPDDYYIFFTGSGTEAIERAIQNCVEKYSLHFVNGAFSSRFYQSAVELGKKAEIVEAHPGEGFDLKNVNISDKIELIAFTHNESSAGVMTPVKEIESLAKKYSDTLFALDVVSSVPYGNLNYKLFDVVFFSVQKGFGLPAGMGVMIVSPRAVKKSEALFEKGVSIGSYHGFPTLVSSAKKNETPETPPILHMYVLGKVIKDMLKIGIGKMQQETEEKASLMYKFLDESTIFSAYVKDPKFRSKTIIVVDIQRAKKDVKKVLAAKGLLVGSGYGIQKETHIRIANFPVHTVADVKRLIKEFKMIS